MKARRPEQFSDSRPTTEHSLDRPLLEYQFETITSRNEETRFANFAKRIAEHVICPNLIPQTGPTGGGDSKVDSETFPVADSLASLWAGIPREASSERWAFAFSAKKKWKEKAQSDVKKIAETGRGYTKAFFISNQFIPDKARAQLEDELRSAYGFDVRILDRTWLVDQVFDRKLEGLAIQELGMPSAYVPTTRVGPGDLQKAQELEEVTQRIEAAVKEDRWTPALVDDCREAALLSRDLERSRPEVEGLFARAYDYAVRCGTSLQRFLVTYDRAWTAFWWHEDPTLAEKYYGELEAHSAGTDNVFELQLLTNIWTILGIASLRAGKFPGAHTAQTETLLQSLARIEGQKERPSSALQARTLRLHIQLQQSLRDDPTPVLEELLEVVGEAEQFAGFPLEPLIRIVEELGDFLGTLPAYANLFEKIVEVRARRSSELDAAGLLANRGAQQLRSGQFTEAIRTLGRALKWLSKDESRWEAIRALSMCAHAYEQLGLLWAARGTALGAAALAIRDFTTYGKLTQAQVACVAQLKWIELQLGRLPQMLAWQELEITLTAATGGKSLPVGSRDDMAFDAILGMTFLNAAYDDLRHLTRLPPTLERLGLELSRIALLYAFGDEEAAQKAFKNPPDIAEGAPDLQTQMAQWRDQPAKNQVRRELSLGITRKLHLESSICGAHILIEADNDPACLGVAESLLGALEGFLATGLADRIMPREPELQIRVRSSDFADRPFSCTASTRLGRPSFDISCAKFDPSALTSDEQFQFQHLLFQSITSILAHGFIFDDVEETLDRMFRDDKAPERSIFFAGNPLSAAHLLGNHPKISIDDWSDEGIVPTEIKRTSRWDSHLQAPPVDAPQRKTDAAPPLLDSRLADIRHSDVRTESVIRLELWDAAKWLGVGFEGRLGAPPVLFLLFKNIDPARQIFQQWASELGSEDHAQRLRISIIRGIDLRNPAFYRVVIGSPPPKDSKTARTLHDALSHQDVRAAIGEKPYTVH
jgi:tetratricopeptide (TPR) repeat protein